jgi:hypothetical protein
MPQRFRWRVWKFRRLDDGVGGFVRLTFNRGIGIGRFFESFEKAEHGLQGWVVRAVFE